MAEGEKDNGALYVLLGCAGLLIVGLCVATGIGTWMVFEQTSSPVYGPTVPTAPPYVPPPTPVPVPPTPPTGPGVGPTGPALPPPPSFAPPALVRATVEGIEGSSPVAVGTACEFTVERHPEPSQPSGYWCRTQIVCGGRLLYGGANAGYFPCTLSEGAPRTVVGRDVETSSADQDAAMTLDTTTAELTVVDDASGPFGAYTVRARVVETR